MGRHQEKLKKKKRQKRDRLWALGSTVLASNGGPRRRSGLIEPAYEMELAGRQDMDKFINPLIT